MSSSPEDEIPRGDLVAAMVALAATDERLCRMVMKADALAEAVKRYQAIQSVQNRSTMEYALDAYTVERSGS